jgi:hypothetical protein
LSTLRNLVELMMLSSCVISRPIEVEALVLLKFNLKTNKKLKRVRTKSFPLIRMKPILSTTKEWT